MIKAGLHLQLQKMGKDPNTTNQIIDSMEDPKLNLIEVVGLDLTQTQHQAINAIQVLISKEENNVPVQEEFYDDFNFQGKLPVLKIRPSEYYQAFGCKKKNGRYSSNETRQAMDVLKSLYDKRYVIYYRKTEYVNGKKKHFTVKVYIPLIGIVKEDYLEDMKQSQFDKTIEMKNGNVRNITQSTPKKRLEHITMEVSPLFVDQIDTFFVQKPENYLIELKEKHPNAGKYIYNFIEYVITQSALQKSGIISIGKDKLVVALRMDNLIRNRKRKAIEETIAKCYEVALALNYIKSAKTIKGKTKEYEEIVISYDRLVKVK